MGLFQQIYIFVAVCVAVSHQQTCSSLPNQDVAPGTDIGSQTGALGACCGICSNFPGCQAFSWNNLNGGTCWLKGATSPLVPATGVTSGILTGGGGGALVSWTEFSAALTVNFFPAPQMIQYTTFLTGLPQGSITTRQEAAMALSQFMHESDGLRARREYACMDPPHCPDHYRTPGCDVPGQFYFGRGYIQLTWCGYNYNPFSLDYFGDDRLRFTPDLVASNDNLAWDSAFWFWRRDVHNFPGVQQGHFGATTRAINGNLECVNPGGHHIARLRFERYQRIRTAWGLAGPGIETGCYN